ncbi:hypothetical protein [uncultured Allofournierella sp.]|uniref:hypothetical protein n=1 Tax=uncultured Allofournierella sp. TaxID=1940258 RepID=UPI0037524321
MRNGQGLGKSGFFTKTEAACQLDEPAGIKDNKEVAAIGFGQWRKTLQTQPTRANNQTNKGV